MSFFKPHKSKPRQFNYVPRYYDPVKEERERRRRELHGTSSLDEDEVYTPGKYIRTQREARDAAREESARGGFNKMARFAFMAMVLVVAMMLFYPRFMRFVERAMEEKEASQVVVAQERLAEGESEELLDSMSIRSITLHEQHGDIDFREFESLTPEIINEIEEWNSLHPNITIYDDDVEIVDGKRVE